jgi:hypothetical protein
MKTRRTKFVAVLSQTFTTTSTSTRTSRVYSEGGNSDYDLKNGEGNALADVPAPLSGSVHQWCVECATPMAMMPPELAATVCFPNYASYLPAGGSGPGSFHRWARGGDGLPGVLNEGLGRRSECRATYRGAGASGRVRSQAHLITQNLSKLYRIRREAFQHESKS